MAESGNKTTITVDARVEGAVRELRRLGAILDTELKKGPKAFNPSTDLAQNINQFRRKFLVDTGMAKEEVARGLINPDQFKALGEEAKSKFQQGILGLISELNPRDPKFFDKFIQLTQNISGPINEKAMKAGMDSSLQALNGFLDEANQRLAAGKASLATKFTAGLIDKNELDRQKLLLDQTFNKDLLNYTKTNLENLSAAAATKAGESFKIIDPKKIKLAGDEGFQAAQKFVENVKTMYTSAKGDLSEKLAKKLINHDDFDRQLRINKNKANESIANFINELAGKGQLSFPARQTLQDAFFKISPDRVAKDVDAGLAEAKKALDRFEGEYRTKRATIREGFAGVGGSENEANLIRQTSVAQSELNAQIMQQIALQRQAGTLSDAALAKLTSGLKIVNPKSIAEAKDQGLQLAESLLRPIQEQFKTRMASIDVKEATGELSRRVAMQMRVMSGKAHNNEIVGLISTLRGKDAAGEVKFTAEAFQKLAGALVNTDTWARHAHTSFHQLRSKIFDFLAVFAAINFAENLIRSAVNDVKMLLAAGDDVAREQGVEKAFIKSAAAIKASSQNLLDVSRKATSGVVDDFEIMRAANTAISLRAVRSQEDMMKLMTAGKLMGRVMGIDATKGVNDLTIALARGSTRVLDNIGVVLKQKQAEEQYAVQLGKRRNELTAEEKARAFAVIGLQKAYERARALGDASDSAAEKTARFNAQLRNQARDLKATIVESENAQRIIGVLTDKLLDEQQGAFRWARAFVGFADDVVKATIWMNEHLNILIYSARMLGVATRDLGTDWNHLFGDGTKKYVSEQVDEIDVLIARLQKAKTTLESAQNITDKTTGRTIKDVAVLQAEQHINSEIARLQKERDKLLGKVTIDQGSSWFLDKYAPLKKPLDDTNPFDLDPETEDEAEAAKLFATRVSNLITVFKNFTEQGRNTSEVVRLLNEAYTEAKTKTDGLTDVTDELAVSYSSAQKNIREALDNVPFEYFERHTRAAVEQYRNLAEMGIASQSAYNGASQALTKVNSLLSRNTGLTDENRVKALKLKKDIKEAFVDAPLGHLDRERNNLMQALDFANQNRLSGPYGNTEELEEHLRTVQESLLNLSQITPPELITTEQEARITRAVIEIDKYFNEAPITRLNATLEQTIGLLEARAELGAETVGEEQRLLRLREEYNRELEKNHPDEANDPMAVQARQGIARINELFRRREETEVQITAGILTHQHRRADGERMLLQLQADAYARAGVSRIAIEAFVADQLAQIRKTELADVQMVADNVASAIGDAFSMLGQQVENLDEQLGNLLSSLLRTFANTALQRGVENLIESMSTASVGAEKTAKGVSGAASSAASTTTSAAAGAATSTGAAAMLGGTGIPGWALLAAGFGMSLVSGFLSRSGRNSEEEQYRATLRALRQDRAEQMVNVTLVLPNKPINPRDPEWQQAILSTVQAAQGTRRLNSLTLKN